MKTAERKKEDLERRIAFTEALNLVMRYTDDTKISKVAERVALFNGVDEGEIANWLYMVNNDRSTPTHSLAQMLVTAYDLPQVVEALQTVFLVHSPSQNGSKTKELEIENIDLARQVKALEVIVKAQAEQIKQLQSKEKAKLDRAAIQARFASPEVGS